MRLDEQLDDQGVMIVSSLYLNTITESNQGAITEPFPLRLESGNILHFQTTSNEVAGTYKFSLYVTAEPG